MPRATRSSKGVRVKVLDLEKAEGKEMSLEEALDVLDAEESEFVPKQGVFDFVVLTFTGLLPGSDGYVREKDKMMIGFRYGNSTKPAWMPSGTKIEDVTPYEFLTNPRTGKRPGQTMAPHDCANYDLTKGINSWVDLPPLYVWKQGRWLSDLVKDPEFDLKALSSWMKSKIERCLESWPSTGVHSDLFPYFVVSGEGTTGNNLYRIYELPMTECGSNQPHHPLMWKESLRKPTETYSGGSNAWKGESWREETNKATYGGGLATKPVVSTAAPKVPAGVRCRCGECGHWFGYQDLIQHSAICGSEEDWAIMCHTDCGCATLDQASTPKPGFPRPKKVEEKKEEVTA